VVRLGAVTCIGPRWGELTGRLVTLRPQPVTHWFWLHCLEYLYQQLPELRLLRPAQFTEDFVLNPAQSQFSSLQGIVPKFRHNHYVTPAIAWVALTLDVTETFKTVEHDNHSVGGHEQVCGHQALRCTRMVAHIGQRGLFCNVHPGDAGGTANEDFASQPGQKDN
jgi:hypothetical protein